MNANRRFSSVVDRQEVAHCGPTSLASCLAMLGIQTNQREIAKAAGKPFITYKEGLDEDDLRRAARKYGAKCDFIQEESKEKGGAFLKKLDAHLSRGLPAVLLVDHLGHWVAVLGMLREKYVIMDPNADVEFCHWNSTHLLRNRAWNFDDDGGEHQYFAILVSRLDGKKAAWTTTRSFLHLCSEGSVQTLADMTKDLKEVALRASIKPERTPSGQSLADLLTMYQETILESVSHWAASDDVSTGDLRSLLRDYMVVADAARIRLPKQVDHASLVAQITTLVSTYAWTGTL